MGYRAAENRYMQMHYPKSGSSGLRLPKVSLGFWHNFGRNDNYENMRKICQKAFDLGITCFDLANNYGPEYGRAEQNFGRIFRQDFRTYRDELLITTKAGYDMWPGPYGDHGSRKYLLASLDQSLQRMGLSYVDIFYHHRMDPETPLEETMGALSQAVRSGKALYVGLSNYDGETMKRAAKILEDLHCPFVVNQNRYSILDRKIEKNGLLDAAVQTGKGIVAFSPLAQGLLTDKYLDGIPMDSRMARDGRYLKKEVLTSELVDSLRSLQAIAQERGESLAQMALAWVLQHPEITSVLIGASRPEQVSENVAVLEAAPFSDEELTAIDATI